MPAPTRKARRQALWRQAVSDPTEKSSTEAASVRAALLESWAPPPRATPKEMAEACWRFLTARDTTDCSDEFPTGRPILWTVDEFDDEAPIKPFPAEKEYLHDILLELWSDNRFVFVDKIRQKYISTITCLALFWYAIHLEEREILVSKTIADLSAKLINDKIRVPWKNLPEWVQRAHPISKEPYGIITALETGSTITAVAETFADGAARGLTGSLILIDEAAYQENFPKIYRAIAPMAARMWAVSTANIGNPGAERFKELIFDGRPFVMLGEAMAADEIDSMEARSEPGALALRGLDAIDAVQHRPGLWAYTTPKTIRVVVLRLGADPADTSEWVARARRVYATQKDWRREMEGDWSSPAGRAYFPVFEENGGRDLYVHVAQRTLKGPVCRAYDTGRRRPSCHWFQYSAPQDRVWGYREFMPHELQTHEFRDAVRFLSGEPEARDEQQAEEMRRAGIVYGAYHMTEAARRWVNIYAAKPTGSHCPPPWFPPGTEFVDIGGKEVVMGDANAFEKDESTFKAIFAAAGIYVQHVSPRVLGRNRVVERMLMMRSDRWPGTFLDPQMEETIAGFEGAFCYPEATKQVPVPTKPRDDGHFINLLDSWGYGVVTVCPEDSPHPVPRHVQMQGQNGREEGGLVLPARDGEYEVYRRV